MSYEDLAKKFASWNEGDMQSYLLDITIEILQKKDDITGEGYVLDYVSLFHHTHEVFISKFHFFDKALGFFYSSALLLPYQDFGQNWNEGDWEMDCPRGSGA